MVELEPVGHQLVIVTFVFGLLALTTLSLRIAFRIRHRKYDGSDTCLIAAMICGLIQSAIQIILVTAFDYGKPKAAIPLHLRTSAWPAKLIYINQIVFKLTTPLCKLSLCLLYRTMCSTSTDRLIRLTRFAIYATINLIIGAYSSAFLISMFQCIPIQSTWNKNIERTCINLSAFRMSTAIFNLLTSILVIPIPIPALTRLSNHRPEVKQLLALILLGLVHTGLTVARLAIMFFPDPLTRTEPQYTHVYNNVLAVVEMHTGILVATLVVMRPAFRAMVGGFGRRYGTGEKMASGRSEEGDVLWGERAHGNGRKGVRYAVLETTEIQTLRDAAQLDHLTQCSQGVR